MLRKGGPGIRPSSDARHFLLGSSICVLLNQTTPILWPRLAEHLSRSNPPHISPPRAKESALLPQAYARFRVDANLRPHTLPLAHYFELALQGNHGCRGTLMNGRLME